ncbi:uncharacterized protein EV420DRAFT_1477179 [Desarmillaria tabescens]|uniref:Uncharacterized protein n=1 Tax=Armillaria tabescens TaxID=1929756 RepID=A0AA39TQ10_ARMTA|nr:uncharacterized protein EV420DRAFT_1477179 [Desarmillaria tabescens]KAK0462463.1 hypothetical protein EV420DRAFT_1477179 [Desarmillaria tabescens]
MCISHNRSKEVHFMVCETATRSGIVVIKARTSTLRADAYKILCPYTDEPHCCGSMYVIGRDNTIDITPPKKGGILFETPITQGPGVSPQISSLRLGFLGIDKARLGCASVLNNSCAEPFPRMESALTWLHPNYEPSPLGIGLPFHIVLLDNPDEQHIFSMTGSFITDLIRKLKPNLKRVWYKAFPAFRFLEWFRWLSALLGTFHLRLLPD